MVATLLATPNAAQESSINRFVIDVAADQRAEILRMRRMLDTKSAIASNDLDVVPVPP